MAAEDQVVSTISADYGNLSIINSSDNYYNMHIGDYISDYERELHNDSGESTFAAYKQ